jgi:polyphosphate glucokinase
VEVLVVDIGGTHVKLQVSSGADEPERFESGRTLTPARMMRKIRRIAADWKYDVVSVGYPGRVGPDGPIKEPGNLAPGWLGFDFEKAFGRPVRVVNDAVMQALGAYDGGRMLFLGLGTGIGSTLVSEHVVVPLELGDLEYRDGRALVHYLGRSGRKKYGHKHWLTVLQRTVGPFRAAFAADYVMLGGGNARFVEPLPPATRRGGNADAITGGFRLWEETVEPHDRQAAPAWRLVR